ncbi:MAG: hypothetical protein WED04_07595 [Promethearchaeati archaeon SRVP18_Atabeyarchaeia-1]
MEGKCPYCDSEIASDQMDAHLRKHILPLQAKIDNVTVDYGNRVAFIHVVVGERGNAKGIDTAVSLPLEMKILGKVEVAGFSFSLLPD